MKTYLVILVLAIALIQGSQCQLEFSNPILDADSADPNIIKVGDFYYLTFSKKDYRQLNLLKSDILTNFRDAEAKVAYTLPDGFNNLWAPEFHMIDGQLYIYFAMAIDGQDHRSYVIQAEDPTNPMGNWGTPIRLMPDEEYSAIDGTVLKHGDGNMYYIWNSVQTGLLSLHIAPLLNASNVGHPRKVLRRPTTVWECADFCVSEGPYFIHNQDVSYLVFSGSSTWDPNYSLGVMSIHSSRDPMEVDNWASFVGPQFYRNDAQNVYTTGHAAFTASPDGTETWMVYHATVNVTHIDGFRTARLEKIDWNMDGTPRFPRPHGYGVLQPVPSGQTRV